MSESTKTYEGMFLVPPGSDFQAASEPIRTVLGRSDADIISIKAWDERRLAYEIAGQRRGLYILTYFKADPTRIGELERDVQLNEDILRVLIIRKDRPSEEEMGAETPAGIREAAAAAAAAAAEATTSDAGTVATEAPVEAAEAPAEASAVSLAEAPVETLADVPTETPADVPTEPPADVPAETPADQASDGDTGEEAQPQTDS